MRNEFKLFQVTFAVFIFLFTVPIYPTWAKEAPILFEMMEKYCSPEGPYCGTVITKIFRDGRYIKEGDYPEKAKSGLQRKVLFREEKQLESQEVAELVSWFEQPDFQAARPEYLVKIVTDIPSKSLTITYRNKEREKIVKVINLFACDEAPKGKVPLSVLKLIKWAKECYEK